MQILILPKRKKCFPFWKEISIKTVITPHYEFHVCLPACWWATCDFLFAQCTQTTPPSPRLILASLFRSRETRKLIFIEWITTARKEYVYIFPRNYEKEARKAFERRERGVGHSIARCWLNLWWEFVERWKLSSLPSPPLSHKFPSLVHKE